MIDALMQTELAAAVQRAVLVPLEEKQTENRVTRAGKAAATKVEFFTMARGED